MNKLETLINRNNRKRQLPSCREQLAKLLNIQIGIEDFLDADETNRLVEKFYRSYKESTDKICKKFLAVDQQALKKNIEDLRNKVQQDCGYLIIKQTEVCGLIKVPIELALEKSKQIIELDGDSLSIISDIEKDGFYLDYFEENDGSVSEWYYELCCWRIC